MKQFRMLNMAAAVLAAATLMLAASCSSGDDSSGQPSSTAAKTAPDTSFYTENSETVAPSSGTSRTETESTEIRVTGASKKHTAVATTVKTTKATSTTLSRTVKVTIPEGWSIPQIARDLEKAGVCAASKFLKTVNEYDFSYYPLVAAIPKSPAKVYKLEGYLAANTYEFYRNEKPQDVIGKMLRATESMIGKRGEKITSDIGDVHELLTAASIVEKEVASKDNRRMVAGIIYNRLEASPPWKLQMDSTTHYLEWYVKGIAGKNIDPYLKTYSSYRCTGIIAGPICSPGTVSINAARSPKDRDKGYMFFCANQKGIRFAVTDKEHDQNLRELGIL